MSKKKEEKQIYNLPKDYLYLTESAQDFLPFDDIDKGMICLPNGHYRKVIEVSAINFYLKTQEEREDIESMFAGAISAWDFPFAFYCQTRVIDGEEIAEKVSKDVDNIREGQVQLKEYGEAYIQEIRNSSNNLIKRNFVIINCDDANYLSTNNTEALKRSYASERLNLAANKVVDSLLPLGLRCKLLSNNELAELLYIAINKNNSFDALAIGDFMSDVVQGQYETIEMLRDRKVDLLFEGFTNQLNNLINSQHELDANGIRKAQLLIDKLSELKKEFDDDDDDSDIIEL